MRAHPGASVIGSPSSVVSLRVHRAQTIRANRRAGNDETSRQKRTNKQTNKQTKGRRTCAFSESRRAETRHGMGGAPRPKWHIMHTPLHTHENARTRCNIRVSWKYCMLQNREAQQRMLPGCTSYATFYVALAHQRLDRSQCNVGALDRCMLERLGVANPIQRALLRERRLRKRTRARLLRAQLPLRSDHVRVRARIGRAGVHACMHA